MDTDHRRSDVLALLDAFSPEQLAVYMARRIHNDGPGVAQGISADYLSLESAYSPALIVAPVRLQGPTERHSMSPTGYTVTVRERTRATGYYIVFENQYARDVVAFWNDQAGWWQPTHLDDAETLAGGNYTNPRPLDYVAVAPFTAEELPDGK